VRIIKGIFNLMKITFLVLSNLFINNKIMTII